MVTILCSDQHFIFDSLYFKIIFRKLQSRGAFTGAVMQFHDFLPQLRTQSWRVLIRATWRVTEP